MILIPAAFALPSVNQPIVTGRTNVTDAAVVVGISDYVYVPDVAYAATDARTFAAFASDTLGISASRIHQPKLPNRENIEQAVADAGKEVGPGGTVWVYFAGHGAGDPGSKERLLLGVDAPNDASFAARGVPVSRVEELAAAGGGKVVLVVDVCYTGDFRSFVFDTKPPQGPVIEWSATAEGQVAAPLEGTDHGAFTYLVLGAFRGWADGEPEVDGGAPGPRDGWVSAREARDYVERRMAALQMRGQTPSMSVGAVSLADGLVQGIREVEPELGERSGPHLSGHAYLAGAGTGSAGGLAPFQGFGAGAGAGLDLAVAGPLLLGVEAQYAGAFTGGATVSGVWLTGGPALAAGPVIVGVGPSWGTVFGSVGGQEGSSGVGGGAARLAVSLGKGTLVPRLRAGGGAWSSGAEWIWSAGVGMEVGGAVR